MRRELARAIADTLHEWLILHRQKAADGTAFAKAIDYSFKRWGARTRHLADGDTPIDNNRLESLIRPHVLGRANWLFASSFRAGQRAAAVMMLIRSANPSGNAPYAYLKDLLERLPSHPASRIIEWLPHRWAHTMTG